MPTYSYACKSCGHRFDAHQSFQDASLTQCPQCHGNLRKLYSSVGVVFKGSGFYRTDSRSSASIPPGRTKHSSDAPAASSSESSSSSSSAAATPSSSKPAAASA